MQFIDIFNIIVIASLSIVFSIVIIGAIISLFDNNKNCKRSTGKKKNKKKKGKKFVLIDKSITINIGGEDAEKYSQQVKNYHI